MISCASQSIFQPDISQYILKSLSSSFFLNVYSSPWVIVYGKIDKYKRHLSACWTYLECSEDWFFKWRKFWVELQKYFVTDKCGQLWGLARITESISCGQPDLRLRQCIGVSSIFCRMILLYKEYMYLCVLMHIFS